MPRKKPDIPPFRLHKASGQAYATIDDRRIYLGRHDTDEAKQRYAQLVAEWTANGQRRPVSHSDLTIVELAAGFLSHAEAYYGPRSKELDHFKSVLSPLKNLYGDTAAIGFGPSRLKAIRQVLVDRNLTRTHVNKLIVRLKHVFRWAAAEELLPATVHQGLQAVPGLKRGRTPARESEPVRPVPDAFVNAVQPFVSRQVWAIIQLQLLTAARAGELVMMRPVDIDMTGRIWTYLPEQHKTAHRGHKRTIYIGPSGQVIIRPFLAERPVDAFLFSPAEAEAERRSQLHAVRKTPLSCGNRPGSNRTRFPRRKPGDHYGVGGYRRAIAYACEKAFPAPKELDAEGRKRWHRDHRWHPHQLRHNAATMLRREFGLEVARVILGHRSPVVTEIYAEIDHHKAIEIMAKIG